MGSLHVRALKDNESIDDFLNSKELKDWTANAYDRMKVEALSWPECENDTVKSIFLDWWNSKSVFTDEYKSKFSKEDHDKAYSVIMAVVSRGFG